MHSSTGLFCSSTDDDWTSAPCVDTLLEAGMIGNLISAANMSQTTWSDYLGKGFFLWTKLCGQAHLPSLTPDPHQHLCFCVENPSVSWAVYPLTTFCLNGELAFDFPELLQGCTVLWSQAGSAYTWAASQPDGPPGGGGAGGAGGDWWISKTLLNIWEIFFLILLHVAHWTGGTRWGAVVDDALWRSSVACSW